MKRWYANPVPDFGLRMVGVVLLAIGWAIGERLHQVATGISVRDASFPMMLLAAIAFLCISTGSALFFVGAGLGEPVEVSERWRRLPSLDVARRRSLMRQRLGPE